MKLRTLPYGYQFADGVLAVQPQERDTVVKIFQDYLGGESLLGIANSLNADSVEYLPGVTGWNKARLKRIIEDERYLGREPYPAILDKEIFDALQRLKAERNTQKNCDRGTDIFQLSVQVKCPLCGCEMHRRYDARIKDVTQRWTCLSKKICVNNGERPKYYVENNHPAIIDAATFGRVQEEIARRKAKRKVKQVGTKTEQGNEI